MFFPLFRPGKRKNFHPLFHNMTSTPGPTQAVDGIKFPVRRDIDSILDFIIVYFFCFSLGKKKEKKSYCTIRGPEIRGQGASRYFHPFSRDFPALN